MAASAFRAKALVIAKDTCSEHLRGLSSTDGFELNVGFNIQTLSDRHAWNDDGIVALLYVPELAPDDPCNRESKIAGGIPSNVTRFSDLPQYKCVYVAVAPWVSAPCSESFLSQAGQDGVAAMLFYRPDQTMSKPPPVEDRGWGLDDAEWASKQEFPVYAVPGAFGSSLMNELARYSGNISDAPHGDRLSRLYSSNATARVYGLIALENKRDTLPGLWVFLLVVLAALVVVVAGSSIVMKIIQHRRRVSLRERITSGDVDLEMLGIKRLKVPQHVLDKLPLYTYDKDGHPPAPDPAAPDPAVVSTEPREEPTNPKNSATLAVPESTEPIPPVSPATYERQKSTFSQTTCPICLDDYVSGESIIRELPCQHIFHPECIDAFLLQNSSLCPVCKKTVFPPGYCPEMVTDAMVRQERYARRSRQQRSGQGTMLVNLGPLSRTRSRRRFIHGSLAGQLGSLQSADVRTDRANDVEASPPPQTPAATTGLGRREEMRRRAVAMLGNHRMVEDEERERDAARPKWLKIFHTVFPALR
ncbi:C3HC4 type (RING finger) zinc finger containing protein [Coccidioides posadasii C735 delta SOWgp]|uniref:C3HC4 type (RING finger) zinc finger containing protein n=1 Tax=Coccidioides posadasii (strain C735) TaxID=222929 RepID=C5P0P7_COCP7|nr:C3HC4 type (RING finger) zinc finger containing protein [Coccidioides posadasii C735 delta SOWgp]EER29255.1 C3HC4 type (RING finger) zinc finger containing protein [Coccidioides posadasii C735 delta SOWgp]|eukprot:XP_003071400.1 C3HC4 type (RING finger) zinc finger containing protein [Coccidioides posadasii C735 delta SOWgp]